MVDSSKLFNPSSLSSLSPSSTSSSSEEEEVEEDDAEEEDPEEDEERLSSSLKASSGNEGGRGEVEEINSSKGLSGSRLKVKKLHFVLPSDSLSLSSSSS